MNTTLNATTEQLHLGAMGKKFTGVGVTLAVIGVGGTLALASSAGAETFWRAYLFAVSAAFAICLGGLFFTILQHIVRAGWSVTVRRTAEGLAANLKWMWILLVPMIVLVWGGNGHLLYEWADTDLVAHDYLLQKKAAYLNPTFWCIRMIAYGAIWAVLAKFFVGHSIAQDADGNVSRSSAMQMLAPIGIVLYALTQTFAAIDWIMSLQPTWFSTMFGVYYFAVSCTGCFATMIILLAVLKNGGKLGNAVNTEHFHDLGKMLFAFGVVFWAYIGFSQYMLIWYANIPVETGWFFPRQMGEYFYVSWILIIGHFMLPFVVLVSRWPKRFPGVIAAIATWMVLMFLVDVYWLVMPVVPTDALINSETNDALVAAVEAGEVSIGWNPHLIQLTAIAGVLGLVLAGWAFALRRCSLVPVRDPRLPEALAFENL
ncbi:MAG: hypothetical protein MK074_02505 [Phycisphaerales bacterium]|nr:hypothetical protein [Phycisphaerales bacterium]